MMTTLQLFQSRYLTGREVAAKLRGYLVDVPPSRIAPIPLGKKLFDRYYDAGLDQAIVKRADLHTLMAASPITSALWQEPPKNKMNYLGDEQELDENGVPHNLQEERFPWGGDDDDLDEGLGEGGLGAVGGDSEEDFDV
ncbi:hypothetical protein LTR27_007581 [Elasticomyces elasticus]|nr:hypothetical protein LTR27_007581 [Elasticomyces elasticus]